MVTISKGVLDDERSVKPEVQSYRCIAQTKGRPSKEKKTTLENFQIYSQSNRNFSTDHPLNVRRKVQITEC